MEATSVALAEATDHFLLNSHFTKDSLLLLQPAVIFHRSREMMSLREALKSSSNPNTNSHPTLRHLLQLPRKSPDMAAAESSIEQLETTRILIREMEALDISHSEQVAHQHSSTISDNPKTNSHR